MYIKLLCLLLALNTRCFGQFPGEGSSEAIGSSGMTFLLKNRESFQDDPVLLSRNTGFGISIQHLLRAKFNELSSKRINLIYHHLGLSLGRQAESPLSIWNGVLATGLPLSNRLQAGLSIGLSAIESIDRPIELIQYLGCMSIRFQCNEQLKWGVRWEHQQFSNNQVASKPALGIEFQPDNQWSLISAIDWMSTEQVLNYTLKIGFQFPKIGAYTFSLATQPFQLGVFGQFSVKKLNFQVGWNYGLPVGTLASQTISYHSYAQAGASQ